MNYSLTLWSTNHSLLSCSTIHGKGTATVVMKGCDWSICLALISCIASL